MSFNFADYIRLDIPEGRVKTITRKSNGQVLWRGKIHVNQVPLSTNADGTIYNDGLGYKDGYRVRSGGTETTSTNTSCTGFILVAANAQIRISGFDFSNASNSNAINVADAAFTNIGQFTMLGASYGIFGTDGDYQDYSWGSVVEESPGVWLWTVPPASHGIRYIRVTGLTGGDGSKMIVTINEEIV